MNVFGNLLRSRHAHIYNPSVNSNLLDSYGKISDNRPRTPTPWETKFSLATPPPLEKFLDPRM